MPGAPPLPIVVRYLTLKSLEFVGRRVVCAPKSETLASAIHMDNRILLITYFTLRIGYLDFLVVDLPQSLCGAVDCFDDPLQRLFTICRVPIFNSLPEIS